MMRSEKTLTKSQRAGGLKLPAVARVLAGADVPREFLDALYGRAAAEDLAAYTGEDLATLARISLEHLQERVPGAPKITIKYDGSMPSR
jgi:hypothetical protein